MFSVPLIPAILVTWVNKQADRFLLLSFIGIEAVGVYGAASKIAVVFVLLVTVLRQAWLPLMMETLEKPEVERDQFLLRVFRLYWAILIGLAALFVAFSREILALLVPDEFVAAYVVIPWLVLSSIIHGSGSIVNVGTIISRRTYLNSVAATIGALLNVGAGVLLIPRFEYWGASIGSVIAELAMIGFLWIWTSKKHNVRFDLRFFILIVSGYLLMSVLSLMSYTYTSELQSLLIRIAALIGVWFAVYVLLSRTEGPSMLSKLVRLLRQRTRDTD